jgi:hypothetical protein
MLKILLRKKRSSLFSVGVSDEEKHRFGKIVTWPLSKVSLPSEVSLPMTGGGTTMPSGRSPPGC